MVPRFLKADTRLSSAAYSNIKADYFKSVENTVKSKRKANSLDFSIKKQFKTNQLNINKYKEPQLLENWFSVLCFYG